ncbi:hypothetical protein BDZ91DRAFT_723838 [Kalaharituber pfeilii]|nr:hypothetical protein BDZ91DRAFT_723838 [Kalaharituber pfeilii]
MERGHKCRPLVITKYSIVWNKYVLVHLLCNTALLLGFMLCATDAIDICKVIGR